MVPGSGFDPHSLMDPLGLKQPPEMRNIVDHMSPAFQEDLKIASDRVLRKAERQAELNQQQLVACEISKELRQREMNKACLPDPQENLAEAAVESGRQLGYDISEPTSLSGSSNKKVLYTVKSVSGSRVGGLSDEEKYALLVLGALLAEAAIYRRTLDTIQARFNNADEVYLSNQSIPQQITQHLWYSYDANNLKSSVSTILSGTNEGAMDEILKLSSEIGYDI